MKSRWMINSSGITRIKWKWIVDGVKYWTNWHKTSSEEKINILIVAEVQKYGRDTQGNEEFIWKETTQMI
jgi:hypothetical protein